MKKLLFVYPNLDLGGSTTALLALLEQLDYTKMQVDLLLLECRESDRSKLPRQVRLLPQAAYYAQAAATHGLGPDVREADQRLKAGTLIDA